MKWFNEEEFTKVRKLIDAGNNAKAIGNWYWYDFKNNATTLAMAYIYAVMNGKCATCTKKLKNLLSPKGKSGPLEFNDVITEIWNHDKTKAINSINLLVENDIPFQIKDSTTAIVLMTNPKFEKVAEAIDKNPNIISQYMKVADKERVSETLLASDNYAMVVKGMDSYHYKAKFNKVRAYKKSDMGRLLRKTQFIINDTHRLKYIKEKIFTSTSDTVEDLFDDLLEVYVATKFTEKDVIDIMSGLTWQNNGNGDPNKLLYHFHKKGDVDTVRAIAAGFGGNLWGSVLQTMRIRPTSNGKKLYGGDQEVDWLVDYLDMMDKNEVLEMIPLADKGSDFTTKVLEKLPELTDTITEKYPDKLPQIMQDIFLF